MHFNNKIVQRYKIPIRGDVLPNLNSNNFFRSLAIIFTKTSVPCVSRTYFKLGSPFLSIIICRVFLTDEQLTSEHILMNFHWAHYNLIATG